MLRAFARRTLAHAAPRGGAAAALRALSGQQPTHPSAADPDTHDDFKPVLHGGASPAKGVGEQIASDVTSHDVFVYMKGTPDAPQCGFSNMVVRILDAYGASYGSRNVLTDPELREGVKKFTDWPTIPQVFVKGEFVGGSDILFGMHERGELEAALKPVKTKEVL